MAKLALLASVLVIACVCVSADLDFSRVHLVTGLKTSAGSVNMLFRGNFPTNKTHMQYDTMLEYMRKRASQVNTTVPDNVYIIDIVLNVPGVDDDKKENDFWAENPNLGELIQWPLGVAGLLPPSAYPESERREIANETAWKVDKIPERAVLLRNLLLKPGPIDSATGRVRPVAVYVHCTAGCDRTGQMIAAYRLNYMINSDPSAIQTVYKYNVEECGRPPNYYSTCGTEWYCLYYQYNHPGRNIGNCLHIADCEFLGKCKWPPKDPNFYFPR